MAPALLDSFAAITIEAALEQLLELDPASRARARSLAGRSLGLTLEPGPVCVTLVFGEQTLRAEAGTTAEATASVDLDPAALAGVLGAGASGAGGVSIKGDTGFAGEVLELLRGLRPDLLAPLARLLGDAPAHLVAEAARRGGATLKTGAASGMEYSRAWLTRPDGWLPGRAEVARFLDDVDDLRLATDRLEARVRRLEQQFAEQARA